MRTKELYEAQNKLKKHINYTGEDKFEKMMLAMMVEFMEAANDWRGFKYWTVNPESKPTLLEEYVDGLHFVLEVGLDLVEMGHISELPDYVIAASTDYEKSVERQFKAVTWSALMLDYDVLTNPHWALVRYKQLFKQYLALGCKLGYTDEQIIEAYMAKNEVNHERQENGY